MSADAPMYREEALRARVGQGLGEIVLAQPPATRWWVALGLVCGLLVLALLLGGQYTRRVAVAGQLLPSGGVMRVAAPAPGLLQALEVREGQAVRRGQLLGTLSFERRAEGRSVETGVTELLQRREDSLKQELERADTAESDERAALARSVAGLRSELARLDEALALQNRRVELSEESSARYEALVEPGHVSREEWQQRRADALDQRARAGAMARERAALQRELASRRDELALLAERQRKQRAALERDLARAGQEREEAEGRHVLQLVAPADAVVAAVLVEAGQSVDAGRTLFRLVPPEDPLQAVLYAPSRAAGPLKPGDTVLLRYQAFPFQKFGHHQGTVREIAPAPVFGEELLNIGLGLHPQLQKGAEPYFRVTVDLPAQALDGPRGPAVLRPGMLLEADLRAEKRRLIEWVFEPLLGVASRW